LRIYTCLKHAVKMGHLSSESWDAFPVEVGTPAHEETLA